MTTIRPRRAFSTRFLRWTAFVVGLLGAFGAGGAEAPEYELDRVSWTGTIEEGRPVTVVNRFGDLRARFGGYEGQVEILANVQQFAAEGPRLEVETIANEHGATITVGYRSESGELITVDDPSQKKRADMVVYVPRGCPLVATTRDGLLQVRGLKSDVRARTVSGRIEGRKVLGNIDAGTESGEILFVLEARDEVLRHSFSSVASDVTLVLSEETDYAATVATGGLISTDFSMEIDLDQIEHGGTKKTGRAVLGKGRGELAITSDRGRVHLMRRPVDYRARIAPSPGDS